MLLIFCISVLRVLCFDYSYKYDFLTSASPIFCIFRVHFLSMSLNYGPQNMGHKYRSKVLPIHHYFCCTPVLPSFLDITGSWLVLIHFDMFSFTFVNP